MNIVITELLSIGLICTSSMHTIMRRHSLPVLHMIHLLRVLLMR